MSRMVLHHVTTNMMLVTSYMKVDEHDVSECCLTTVMHDRPNMMVAANILFVGAIIWLQAPCRLMCNIPKTISGKACTVYSLSSNIKVSLEATC